VLSWTFLCKHLCLSDTASELLLFAFTSSWDGDASSVHVRMNAFRFSPPRVWNSLPASIRESHSLPTLRHHLKTFYFQSANPPFSCPAYLEYHCLRAVILVILWRYISHVLTYLNTPWPDWLIDWVRLNVPPTQYRSYGDGTPWPVWQRLIRDQYKRCGSRVTCL